jgi:hypothetical protein
MISTVFIAILLELISWSRCDRFNMETVAPVACTCPSILQQDNTQNWFFCGFELNDNCSRYVVYKCKNGSISAFNDCPFHADKDRQIKEAHYCMLSPRRNDQRYCAFIHDCKEVLGLCGFPSLQAVKDVIQKNPDKRKRDLHLLYLNKPEKCKPLSCIIPT